MDRQRPPVTQVENKDVDRKDDEAAQHHDNNIGYTSSRRYQAVNVLNYDNVLKGEVGIFESWNGGVRGGGGVGPHH